MDFLVFIPFFFYRYRELWYCRTFSFERGAATEIVFSNRLEDASFSDNDIISWSVTHGDSFINWYITLEIFQLLSPVFVH